MASQRPPWFRFPNIGRAPAPAPPPQPQPPIVRPAIPLRAPPPQAQPQEPAPPQPPPPQPAPAPGPPQPPPSQPAPTPAPPPRPPIVRPMIPVRAPPPQPQPAQPQEPAPPQPPPSQPTPPPKNSPTPSPVQPRSPEVVAASRSPTPKDQVPSSPRRPVTPTPPPVPPRSSPVTQRRSPTPPAPSSPPEIRAKPASPSVPLNVPDETAANGGSVKAATPVAVSPKEVVKVKLQSTSIVEKTSTPVHSPKAEFRPLPPQPHHPSPLKLPPAHFNSTTAAEDYQFEQKNVLVQDKISKPPADKTHHGIPNSSNHSHNNTAANGKHHDRSGTKMITLAGENKGAVMELTSSPNSPNSQREKIQSSKIFAGKPRTLLKEKKKRLDGEHSGSESGEEGGRNTTKGRAGRATDHHQSPPTNAIFNSNVQGINNSIVLNSNFRHKDPGVHFSLARKANGGHSKEHQG